ncbi:GtrA family protein [Trebonia kvetii]|uniref:GtrA family protein n=2 Tax=Trebonia kvetii TaxID=2480626 RepID=A0A6P2BYN0_9ACTN|nr:GtrA family protein [Trebonia kvetii]
MVLRGRHREGAFARLRCIQVMTSRLATAGVPGTREELSQLSLIRDYYLRFRVLIHEIGKFGVVGLVATIITFAVQNALYGHAGPTTSVVVANAIATCFAYLGNRYWAFRHRKTANMGRETVLFVFFNLVGTVIQTAFVDFNHYALGNHDRISLNIATVIGMVFATLFRLVCYRKFVFNSIPPEQDEAEELATATLP